MKILDRLRARSAKTHDSAELFHIACDCSPTVNLCGLVQEHTGWAEGPWPANACVVCLDLNGFRCQRCRR